mmetsp:Transcript_13873/g.39483  ORF Transcript_13873/g.39483 Transcript_13873/m.39483 type:complete len:175 (+) Transcript_13873:85-609(+)
MASGRSGGGELGSDVHAQILSKLEMFAASQHRIETRIEAVLADAHKMQKTTAAAMSDVTENLDSVIGMLRGPGDAGAASACAGPTNGPPRTKPLERAARQAGRGAAVSCGAAPSSGGVARLRAPHAPEAVNAAESSVHGKMRRHRSSTTCTPSLPMVVALAVCSGFVFAYAVAG